MKPIEFPEQNAILAKDQPEYQPLPVFRDEHGFTVSRWRLTFWERIKLVLDGRIWLLQLTFNRPLQPQLMQLESPFGAPNDNPAAWVQPTENHEGEDMPKHDNWLDLGSELADLADDQAEWSQATFGSDKERGPVGPLKHLEKEAREAAANPSDISEHADCLILILDASRRAGFTILDVVRAATEKMIQNKARTWPKATAADMPVEHVR